MTERAYTSTRIGGSEIIKWTGLQNGDTGTPLHLPFSPDKTAQFYGTWGTGGSVTLQGSNDGKTDVSPTFNTLHKPDLNNLTYGANGIDAVLENPNLIRPSVTAGDGTTNLTVILVFTRK